MQPPSPLAARALLIVSEPFGRTLPAPAVADAIARGVLAAGCPQPDLFPLIVGESPASPGELLDAARFDERMRAARAVIVACERLQERALAGSPMFEVATRARQGGVPAYAIAAENRLDSFDARILDLQLVLEARTPRALAAAGRRLAAVA